MTNSLGFLPEVDEIIMLDNGNIVEMGSYDELVEKDGQFAQFIQNYFTSSDKNDKQDEIVDDKKKKKNAES